VRKSRTGKRLGLFLKEKHEGDFVKAWNRCVDDAGFDKVDANGIIASVLAVKDEAELSNVRRAAELTNKIFAKHLKDTIINIVDGEKKVRHAKLSEGVEQAINDTRFVPGEDKELVEVCYPAIIQSGGNFNLKFSAASDKNNLHFGCIVCALGFRYKNYCANIVRTMLVDPTEKMQENYKFLVTLEEELIASLRDGAKLNEVYEKIRAKCQSERPELVDKLTANFGFVIGIEFREPAYLITAKCTAEVKSGMTFQVCKHILA
jgi:nucleosome binding factor SPN SPT16 subunit